MEDMKVCSCCGTERPITSYSYRGYDAKGNHIRRNVCKHCESVQHKESYVPVSVSVPKVDEDLLVLALLFLSRNDIARLNDITEDDFLKYAGGFTGDFDKLKKRALSVLKSKGEASPSTIHCGDGNYLVCGDSFGKHTKTAMFDLLRYICSTRKINKVIHVGEALDDDNEVSNLWNTLGTDVVFVTKSNELEEMYKQQALYKFSIAKSKVELGNIIVTNQEQVQPYTKTAISAIDFSDYRASAIVNCTRHELSYLPHSSNDRFIASPGTLAVPFVKRTIKQFSFVDGFKAKLCYTKDFIKYRRMKEIAERFWENGIALVNVRDGIAYTSMVRIKWNDKGCYTYIDGVCYASNKEVVPTNYHKTVAVADLHVPNEDGSAVGLVKETIGSEFFDEFIINGDIFDARPCNPHVTGVQEGDMLFELYHYNNFLTFFKTLAMKSTILFGNHDHFYMKWLKSFPAFKRLFQKVIYNVAHKLEYKFTRTREGFDCEPYLSKNTAYVHGHAKFFGTKGSMIEKNANNFDQETVVLGHTHSPEIRFGAYVLPCLCKLDQGYNTPYNSNWKTGFGIVCEDSQHSFCQLYVFNQDTERRDSVCFNNKLKHCSDSYLYLEYKFTLDL
jgi:predicted phosphodiesterase